MSETRNSAISTFNDTTHQPVFDQWVRSNVNSRNLFSDFTIYFDMEGDMIKQTGLLRFIQSMINNYESKSTIELSEYKLLFHKLFEVSSIEKTEIIEKFIQMIEPMLQPKIKHKQNVKENKNLCAILLFFIGCYFKFIKIDFKQKVFKYLMNNFDQNQNLETILLSLLCLEIFFQNQNSEFFNQKQVILELIVNLNKSFEPQNQIDEIKNVNDSLINQIVFLIDWFYQKFLTKKMNTKVKELTHHLYQSIRNDSDHHESVVQNFKSFYYEVTLLTVGPNKFGWSTGEKLGSKFIGGDPNSIGIDFYQGNVWHNGKMLKFLSKKVVVKVGDIVGCLIDPNHQQFQFTLNGQMIQHEAIEFNFETKESYYPVLCLGPHQHCWFNFGQTEFKFAAQNFVQTRPELIQLEQQQIYQISDTVDFKPSNLKLDPKQIEQFFQVEHQIEFDKYIMRSSNKNETQKVELNSLIQKHGFIPLVNSINKKHSNIAKKDRLYEIDKSMRDILRWINLDFNVFLNTGKFFETINPFLESYSQISEREKSLIQSTICLSFYFWIIDNENISLNDKIFNFLSLVISESEDLWTVLIGLVCIQSFLDRDLCKENCNKLKSDAKICTKLKSLACPTDSLDSLNQQISFTAQNCLNQVNKSGFQSESKMQNVFVPIGLSTRNNLDSMIPIRSSYPVILDSRSKESKLSKYFYEAILLTDGPIHIGWCTRACDCTLINQENQDHHSILFSPYNHPTILHNGKEDILKNVIATPEKYQKTDKCPNHNVIGCLIDLKARRFRFYLNGTEFTYQTKIHFLDEPYFAFACIKQHQMVCFNFGQSLFHYPPKGVEYSNFHSVSNEKVENYRLLETCYSEKNKFYYFLEDQNENNHHYFHKTGKFQQSLDFFLIKIQNHIFDSKIAILKNKICTKAQNSFINLMNPQSKSSINENCDCLFYHRLVQAILTEKITKIPSMSDSKISILWNMIENLNKIYFIKNESFQLEQEFFRFKNPSHLYKLVELIHFYFNQIINRSQNIFQELKIGLILSLIGQIENFDLSKQIVDLLSELLDRNQRDWPVLMAMVGIENFSKNPQIFELLRNENKITSDIVKLSKINFEPKFLTTNSLSLDHQIGFCAKHLLERVFQVDDLSSSSTAPIGTLINFSENLKISKNEFSVRCDHRDSGSIQYQLPTGPRMQAYYETVLLTNGPMRIGWTTSDSIENTKRIGDNAKSIGLDLYTGIIWYNGKQIKTTLTTKFKFPKSKKANLKTFKSDSTCDVIGCLLDTASRRFKFYLNGQLIGYQKMFERKFKKIKSKLFYPAASLGTHQQIWFNFGQEPFMFAPKGAKSLYFKDSNSNQNQQSNNGNSRQTATILRHYSKKKNKQSKKLKGTGPRVKKSNGFLLLHNLVVQREE